MRKAYPLFFLIKDRLKSFDCRLTKVYTGGLFFINQTKLVDPDILFGPVAGVQPPLNVANLLFDSTRVSSLLVKNQDVRLEKQHSKIGRKTSTGSTIPVLVLSNLPIVERQPTLSAECKA